MSRIPSPALLPALLTCVVLAACNKDSDAAASKAPVVIATAKPTPTDVCEARRARHDKEAGRIVGGEPAKPGSAPWQVELLSSPKYDAADRAYDASLADDDACKIFLAERSAHELAHKCGGAWIGDGWVLTAAHCVDDIPGFDDREGNVLVDRRIRLGSQNLTVDDGLFAIDAVVIHGAYKKATKHDDIALARVVVDPRIAAFEANGRLAAVPLMGADDRDFDPGEALRVTGWGWMGRRELRDAVSRRDSAGQLQRYPADLQQLSLNYLPDAVCAKEYGRLYGPGALCAGALAADGGIEMGKDSCQGDSGGPLTREEDSGRRRLVGLVSNGKGCGAGVPALYTRISHYGGWILAAKAAAKSGKLERIPQPADATGSR